MVNDSASVEQRYGRCAAFFVEGRPVPQPRMLRNAGDPNSAEGRRRRRCQAWRELTRIEAVRAARAESWGRPATGALRVDVTFHFPRPKSHFDSAGELLEEAPTFHTQKPDEDNLRKAVYDAMRHVFWEDDCQVALGIFCKSWCTGDDDVAGANVEVMEVL